MHCNPTSFEEHDYSIFVLDYFTKWAEAMPYAKDGKFSAMFLFNHIIARFGVPQAIVINHGSQFKNHMMYKLSSKLVFHHDNLTPYYP